MWMLRLKDEANAAGGKAANVEARLLVLVSMSARAAMP